MKCIFCSIVSKALESKIIYEDSELVATLEIPPKSRGACIVFPKKHYSQPWEDEKLSKKTFDLAVKISKAVQEQFKPVFVSLVFPPSQSNHFHIKILPYYQDQIPLVENKPIEISVEELENIRKRIAEAIKGKEKEEEKPVKKEEVKPVKRSEEEVYWIKREISLA